MALALALALALINGPWSTSWGWQNSRCERVYMQTFHPLALRGVEQKKSNFFRKTHALCSLQVEAHGNVKDATAVSNALTRTKAKASVNTLGVQRRIDRKTHGVAPGNTAGFGVLP